MAPCQVQRLALRVEHPEKRRVEHPEKRRVEHPEKRRTGHFRRDFEQDHDRGLRLNGGRRHQPDRF